MSAPPAEASRRSGLNRRYASKARRPKKRRLHVLELDHPRHRFHHHGVDPEQRGGEPGAPDLEPSEDSPQEEDARDVEHEIDEVVAEGLEPPQLVLDPERREHRPGRTWWWPRA